VTAVYAAPADKDSGSQGEWFSLFNRSADTLDLGGCRLGRDRSVGVTHAYAFDSAASIPPGRTLSFGRAASRADFHYDGFTLVNTASPLLVLCGPGPALIDSLRYSSSAADSAGALPMREGWVTRLSASGLGRRSEAAAWCLARPETAPPGSLEECAP
jgi:hypothetical protein